MKSQAVKKLFLVHPLFFSSKKSKTRTVFKKYNTREGKNSKKNSLGNLGADI